MGLKFQGGVREDVKYYFADFVTEGMYMYTSSVSEQA